ncbi:MAG: uracil-DNA glycosylase [Patescibacteria group bacterium]
MSQAIAQFIHDLAAQPALPKVQNPWDYSRPENELRRANLFHYLTILHERAPRVLLVGEAPGYRGCARVGIPFTSERQILEHPFFTTRSGFSVPAGEKPVAEASASIVWKTFDALDFYPLMWATFPYHPHQPGKPASNRPPTAVEIRLGQPFLTRLLELYQITEVVAVGRVAERTLREIGIPATPVRHPSHGGATQFAAGLAAFRAGER